ncbi:MAG: glycosyl hydrolase family 5 [Pedobacter sp.]|nr:glycosyl hydrolase family 5 [Pedobacter sp.]
MLNSLQNTAPSRKKQSRNIKFLSLIAFLILFLTSTNTFSQAFLKAQGTKIVNGEGQNVLLKGIGLGGWMLQEGYMMKVNKDGQQYRLKQRIEELIGPKQTMEFYDGWLNNHTRKADVDSLKAWGFNSIRLPMHYNLYTLAVEQEPVAGKNTWLEKGFALTDSLLAWCKSNHMYLILDLHAAPGGQGNDTNISDRDASKPSLWESEANKQKTIDLWVKLAERYKDEEWIGAYDIINEPNWGFQNLEKDKNGTQEKLNAPLRQLMVEITKAIRTVDQKHMVIIEGNGWGNNYNGIFPLWDKNIALSFHKYWNYNDEASINGMLKIREENQVPIWLGETGENSNVWFTDAIRLFEKNNIGWSWWPLKKIGFNNPMEIKTNPQYEAFVKYLNEGGNKPAAADVYKGLVALAEASKSENNVIHRDVIDAMIRLPLDPTAKPFRLHVIQNNAVLKAVDYDLGPNGVAYFDKDTADYHTATGKYTAGNRGRTYRNDGVDIAKDSTANDGYIVNHIEDGEWLRYTVQVTKAGLYNLQVDAAAGAAQGRISILVDDKSVARDVAVPSTGDVKAFKSITINNVPLKRGKQVIKVVFDKGGFNLRSIKFASKK